MKVFISHSSKDKWAARRISEDLVALHAETFLDEKDISTGESIDSSIKSNLKDCDDFLILLSPASIKSAWVLIELGGAFALEKKVIPILLYVGANEIPKIINLKLARDINDIGKYYDEIVEKLTGTKPETASKARTVKRRKTQKLKVGDVVKIVSSTPPDHYRDTGLDIYWEDGQEPYLGKTTKIIEVLMSSTHMHLK